MHALQFNLSDAEAVALAVTILRGHFSNPEHRSRVEERVISDIIASSEAALSAEDRDYIHCVVPMTFDALFGELE